MCARSCCTHPTCPARLAFRQPTVSCGSPARVGTPFGPRLCGARLARCFCAPRRRVTGGPARMGICVSPGLAIPAKGTDERGSPSQTTWMRQASCTQRPGCHSTSRPTLPLPQPGKRQAFRLHARGQADEGCCFRGPPAAYLEPEHNQAARRARSSSG